MVGLGCNMPCYKPLKAFRTPTGVVFQELSRHDIIGRIDLACGQCIGCRMRKASDWALRVSHEAQMWNKNCFVTLTYAPGNLPAYGSLEHRDFQLFMKRLRTKYAPDEIRFYMCGEYGPLNQRPHYHACLFNIDVREDWKWAGRSNSGYDFFSSEILTELWGLGSVTVQPLTPETASYCARYIMSKLTGDKGKEKYDSIDSDGVVSTRKPPYAAMSLKPGIGARWFSKFGRDVYPHDFVIQDGMKKQPPKYYDKLLKRSKHQKLDEIEYARQKRAIQNAADNTDERLKVRETVNLAKVKTLARNMDK